MITIERLKAEDFEECMDLIDLVFSQAHRPHDFVASVPKTNRPEDECMRHYYALREDGKMRSAIMSWEENGFVAGHPIKEYGIGNVATLQRCNGKGFMGMVMDRVQKDMEAEGCDMSELGGLRQRYDHFGYEHCGSHYSATVSLRNCNRCLGKAPEFRFYSLEPEITEKYITAMCRALYESSPVHTVRGDDKQFLRHLISWGSKGWYALDENELFAGYISASADGNGFSEFFARDPETKMQMCYAWLAQGYSKNNCVSFILRPWEVEAIRSFGMIAESLQISSDHQIKIFNWDKVTEAFFDLKASYAPLADGDAVIGIEEWGNLSLSVQDGKPSVSKTDKEADITLEAKMAERFMFGPHVPYMTTAIPDSKAILFANWFPLPLSWHGCDCV